VWKHRHILPTTVRKILQRPQSRVLYPPMFVFHPNSKDASDVLSAIWTAMQDIVGLSVEHSLALGVYREADGQYRLVFRADEDCMGTAQLDLRMRQVEASVTAMALHPDTPVPELVTSVQLERQRASKSPVVT
jgi:hypothetical protein